MKRKLLKCLLFFMVLLVMKVSAQDRTITGVVKAKEDGLPVPGVSVKVKGTSISTSTDASGAFSIRANANQSILFSYIGFLTQDIPVGNKSVINVSLLMDAQNLQEVVVTDGYRTTTQKANTSSIGTIKGEALENKPFSTVQSALQGQIAGVSAVVSSGQPGANVNIRIRGLGSFALTSNPLYVIDGMIVNSGDLSSATTTANALAGVNENDIESIDVLKDAAATALYGSRGSNGVIVITTKKGKAGKTQVRFDAEAGASSLLDIPDAGKPLTADQYAELFKEALTNGGNSATAVATAATNYGLNSGKSNDWYDLVTRTGTQQQYNVSLTGGTEKTKVFASAGYFKQQATTIGSDFKRISGLFNVDHQISKRITLSTGINFSNVDQHTPSSSGAYANPLLAAYFLRPFQLAYNDDGSLNISRTGSTNFTAVYNPLYTAVNDTKHLSETRVLGNSTLKWNIWDKLKYTSYFSIDYNTLEETVFWNSTHGDGRTYGGYGYDYYTRYFNWLTRNQLDYRYDIPGIDDFYVSAAVGYEAQRSKMSFIGAVGQGFPSSQASLTALSNASTPLYAYGTNSNYAFNSLYSTASLNFKNKYAISGSFRRDGSSRFGENNRFANFWSVGGTWNVDQEDFFKAQNIFSSAKFRSSYGTTGNAGLGNYDWRATAGYSSSYAYAGYTGQQYNVIGSADLVWETSKKFDVGTELGFFKDRFSLIVDYYHNNIDGLIQSVATSRTTGFSSINQNIGSMSNKGWEFTIKGDVIRSRDFNWNSNFNISFNKNKITSLAEGTSVQNGNFYRSVGYDYYTYYLKESAGVDPQTGSQLYWTDGTHAATTTSWSAAQYVTLDKQSDPKAFGGFNNNFRYKGFTLGVDFYYNFGNWIYGSYDSYLLSGAYYTYNKYQYVYENRWTTPGQITDVPKYSTSSTDYNFSSRYLYSGDYIRLRNLTLGYDFKDLGIMKKLGITKLYIYGRGTNLWTKTFDDRLPFDPEVNIAGSYTLDIPKVKTYTIGINVGL
ncbi:TonB-dependent receptor [Pedobacter aquatilis]|uniref:SusC/RagA family TonB-linked outer membrane protein n=1 Tax=Pedobacter aquatilis TaxID=351343 RepID=UPI0029305977|nr:TonB-dependent receptor [Pedobacter aquatilis]